MKASQARTTEIPDRVYFRIGEVSNLVGVDPHVLRYWETEFKIIKPRRAKSRQRLYRRKDVENLLRIKTLLHDEGYTIAGARRLLSDPKKYKARPRVESTPGRQEQFTFIKEELRAILEQLSSH